MKQSFLNWIIIVFSVSIAHAQPKQSLLKVFLLTADTVLIVSHDATAGIFIVDDSTKKNIPLPKLVVRGKPNYQIFHEVRLITDSSLNRLIKIIDRPFKDRQFELSGCFVPHHAIVIIKNGKTSYIDICFGCRGIARSKDLIFMDEYFDDRKWKELYNFFMVRGIKYEMGLEDHINN